jgi:hypothetical protein
MKAPSKLPKKVPVTRAQVVEVIFRTMRIEEPTTTREMAKKAAKTVRLPLK